MKSTQFFSKRFHENFAKSNQELLYYAWFHEIFSESMSKKSRSIVWKNKRFTFTEKIFRQINYLIISTLLSRNFSQNGRVFRNFYTVSSKFDERNVKTQVVVTIYLRESNKLVNL